MANIMYTSGKWFAALKFSMYHTNDVDTWSQLHRTGSSLPEPSSYTFFTHSRQNEVDEILQVTFSNAFVKHISAFLFNFQSFLPQWSSWKQVNISLVNGSAPNEQQAIYCTTYDCIND